MKEAAGHSPLSLIYGSEAVLPVEVGVPSPGMTFYEHDKKVNLDLLPESRGNALLRSICDK